VGNIASKSLTARQVDTETRLGSADG